MRQIRNLLSSGAPGVAAIASPPERGGSPRNSASERGHVREALRKPEFYGVLQTFPQSGTIVASLGAGALERLISNHQLDLNRDDIKALTETRGHSRDAFGTAYAAQRASKAAIAGINERARGASRPKSRRDAPPLRRTFCFTWQIAKSAQNRS